MSVSSHEVSKAIERDSYVLSIVIPCYNEAATIATIVERVQKSTIPRKQIIVVNDGSTDGTAELLNTEIAPVVDKIIHHTKNQGKGAAIRTGLIHVTGDVVIIQDGDLEYNPNEYPRLIAPILESGADVVYGSRFSGGEAHRVVFFWHMVANRALTLLVNCVTNINLTDMETGYKAFRRDAIQSVRIEENRFGFEPEITIKLAKLRKVFYEVGIGYFGRTYEEGKKIGLRDAFRAVYAIFKYSLFR